MVLAWLYDVSRRKNRIGQRATAHLAVHLIGSLHCDEIIFKIVGKE